MICILKYIQKYIKILNDMYIVIILHYKSDNSSFHWQLAGSSMAKIADILINF
jgi:hypothetical protein